MGRVANMLVIPVSLLLGAMEVGPTVPAYAAQPMCFGKPATVVGSGHIVGTPGDDVIVGSDGRDVILGLGGDDLICGGNGDDEILGGDGNDRLDGGAGNDRIVSGAGDNEIDAGSGDDVIVIGSGNQVIRATSGSLRIITDSSDDDNDVEIPLNPCLIRLDIETGTNCEAVSGTSLLPARP